MVEACAGCAVTEALKAISLHCRTAKLAPRTWLMLEASFPTPLLDGKCEPETTDPLGKQAVVAAAVFSIFCRMMVTQAKALVRCNSCMMVTQGKALVGCYCSMMVTQGNDLVRCCWKRELKAAQAWVMSMDLL